jgi:hypothetical protein
VVVYVALGWLVATCTKGQSMDRFAVYFIQDIPFGEVNAMFTAGGPSTVTVTGNYQSKPEIGVYEATLSDERTMRLRDQLRTANYIQYPAAVVLKPEMATTVIGLLEPPADMPELRSFPRRDVPLPLLPIIAEMEDAVAELMKHPKHVVSGVAAWQRSSLSASDDLVFTVTLKNIGSDVVELDAPSTPDEDGRLPLTIEVWPDKPEGSTEDRLFVELSSTHLYQESSRRSFWSKKNSVIMPNEEITVGLKKRVHLAPGRYRAQLTFMTKGSDADARIRGRLQIELGPLTVLK